VLYCAVLLKALADDSSSYQTKRNLLDFLQHVSTDKALRDASVAADKKLSEFDVEIRLALMSFNVGFAFCVFLFLCFFVTF